MAVKVLRYRTLIFYSDVDSNECRDHILKMQEEGWERIDERSLVNNGYEVEFEKWTEVDLTASQAKTIKDAVDRIVSIYKKEDYDYVVSLAKKGQKACGTTASVDDEVEFIKRNKLCEGLSDKDINTVAELALQQIKSIEDEVYAKYYRK